MTGAIEFYFDFVSLIAANDGNAGLFGSPSFVVGDELLFGNDRLEFVAAALAAATA